MNIIYSSDDNYANYLLVSMLSVLDNTCSYVNFHILDAGISDKSKEKISSHCSNYDCSIKFYDLSDLDTRLSFLKIETISISSYARLFILEILSEDISKALYLDADSIVVNDISELYSNSFKGCSICAVTDLVPSVFKSSIKLENPDRYFNAGMVLLDLNKMRSENHLEKYMNIMKKFSGEEIPHHDQGVFNIAYNNDVNIIGPKYNCMTPFLVLSYEKICNIYSNESFYTEEQMKIAKESPVFVHLTQSVVTRPWVAKSTHPYSELYKKYMDKIGASLISDERKISVRLVSSLILNYPSILYKIFAKCYGFFRKF
ncbi:glycosyltransferase family 8 protein [Vibrio crassostreae]|uniref:glycosyltransferase family 8 protein n=1 Tax=Vibrio crassostreae TaxID=246167 RepID=UPI0010465B03|nr:glycosyltransferase family 8 protein [Vibrio crassostreae]TCT71101.1 lipopolysaccharide biosynthesis glycosyltransferase [Vibrio crassostreae]CAK2197453.1 putative Glycosyltransferase family 8 protein [Vibrio crassostreae]CAK2402380.1 putative Glycosyltransferase family 8 protein [Vibrio crassostreae]CAK2907033.1 putative Glycosyltransferase family 8 protein [Vibrio crassostreae]